MILCDRLFYFELFLFDAVNAGISPIHSTLLFIGVILVTISPERQRGFAEMQPMYGTLNTDSRQRLSGRILTFSKDNPNRIRPVGRKSLIKNV
jgi:hypothetical protein